MADEDLPQYDSDSDKARFASRLMFCLGCCWLAHKFFVLAFRRRGITSRLALACTCAIVMGPKQISGFLRNRGRPYHSLDPHRIFVIIREEGERRLVRLTVFDTPQEDAPAAGGGAGAAGNNATAAGFRDFLLKPELLRAVNDCAFEHPSKGTGQL